MAVHRTYILLFLAGAALLLLGLQYNGPKEGRKGNAHYEAEEYERAIEAYRRGLRGYPGGAEGDPVFQALLNNLGAALHRTEAYSEAADVFEHALRGASTTEERSRTAYNAGNNAYRQGAREAALDFYREALLADPENESARHNYEFVKRQRESESETLPGDEEGDGAPPEEGEGRQEGELPPEEEGMASMPMEPRGGQDGSAGDQLLPTEPGATSMSPEQALRILDALELDELELLREALRMDAPRRPVDKDW